jgi:hypothetical protein
VTEKNKKNLSQEAGVLTQIRNWYSLQYYLYHILPVLRDSEPFNLDVCTLLVTGRISGHPVGMSASSQFYSRRFVMVAGAAVSTTPLGNHVRQWFGHVISVDARLPLCIITSKMRSFCN